MGLKERFGQGSQERPEVSEAARRERAAARAQAREARRQRATSRKRIAVSARGAARAASEHAPQASRALDAGAAVLREAGKIVLEVFVLVTGAWMAAAEIAGRLVLAAWLRARPLAIAGGRAAVAGVRLAQRRVRPAHGTLAVAAAAVAVLVVSQFVDYRGISVGTGEYAGVEQVAPAPEVSRDQTGDAHAWLVLPIAAAALIALAIAALGRRRAAWLLIPAGAAVLAIGFFVDMPKGLDEGSSAIAYEGVKATLLEGFWAQLFAAGTLIVCGILLPVQLAALRDRGGAPGGSSARSRSRARPRTRPTEAARA